MQRVLFEILRRSSDTSTERQSKKRKSDVLTRDDGKYAEQGFRRETRGARPGMIDWQVKRRCTEGWEQSLGKKMYNAVYE